MGLKCRRMVTRTVKALSYSQSRVLEHKTEGEKWHFKAPFQSANNVNGHIIERT